MVTVSISEITTAPAVPSQVFTDELFFVSGISGATGATVPAIGALTRVRNQAEADIFGDYADGTLPRALRAIFTEVPNADVVAVRHDNSSPLTAVQAVELAPNVERDFRQKVTGIVVSDQSWTETAGSVDNTTANDLVTAARAQAVRLGCIAFVSGPATSVADYTGWLAINAGDRVVGAFRDILPAGQTVATLPGAVAAAAILKRRRTRGYYANPNFTPLVGINSASPDVYFAPRSSTSDSQTIVSAHGVTFIDDVNGWRFYGREMMQSVAGADHRNSISIRTTLDRLEQYAQAQLILEASTGDGNLTPAFVDSTVGALKSEINRLLSLGALRQGDAYPDPALDTMAERDLGNLHLIIIANGTRNVASVSVRIVAN